MQKPGFTLIEILVVLVILGSLSAMVVPILDNTTQMSKANINKTMMQDIKRASLAFRNDVGFAPDRVALMIYPFEECSVLDKNYDSNVSGACKNMIAFVDSRLTMDSYRISSVGDYGSGTRREQKLMDEIKRRLDPKQNGWRGSYIGGNGHLLMEQIKKLGGSSSEKDNKYFLSKKDIDIYYDGFDKNATLDFVGAYEYEKWLLMEGDFPDNNETAKYRANLFGELTILDPWGTPYEIQFPQNVPSGKSRERFARIVSFGENRQRDTNVSVLDIPVSSDDSVIYIYENNQTNYFHQL